MSDIYGGGGGGYGGASNPRDRITQALMQINNPPPGGPQIAPGMASMTGGMPPQPLPTGAMPQVQPAGIGAVGPPTSPMGPIGSPFAPGLNLPGIMPAGQLPQGQRPY